MLKITLKKESRKKEPHFIFNLTNYERNSNSIKCKKIGYFNMSKKMGHLDIELLNKHMINGVYLSKRTSKIVYAYIKNYVNV